MPKRFTPEQFAASAAAGEPRSEQFFSGDSGAGVRGMRTRSLSTARCWAMLPPVGDGRRAGCWKRARRQRGKIEAQREKKAADVALVTDENDVTNESQQQLHKRLKVSEHWRSEHAASILELRTSTPRASPSGKHAVRELRAVVATPGGVNSRECCVEVRYDLLPAEGESEEAAKQRDDRNRRREQLALGRLAGVPEQEEQARRKEEAAEAARLERMAAVVRDGNFILLT